VHLAKGPAFRAAVVMACDDEVIPLQERIETVGDDADLQEVYDTERHNFRFGHPPILGARSARWPMRGV